MREQLSVAALRSSSASPKRSSGALWVWLCSSSCMLPSEFVRARWVPWGRAEPALLPRCRCGGCPIRGSCRCRWVRLKARWFGWPLESWAVSGTPLIVHPNRHSWPLFPNVVEPLHHSRTVSERESFPKPLPCSYTKLPAWVLESPASLLKAVVLASLPNCEGSTEEVGCGVVCCSVTKSLQAPCLMGHGHTL